MKKPHIDYSIQDSRSFSYELNKAKSRKDKISKIDTIIAIASYAIACYLYMNFINF